MVAGGTSEERELTELSPVAGLHIPDTTNIYCHNNSQSYHTCKVTNTLDILMPVFLNKTDPQDKEYTGLLWRSSINLFKSMKDKS